MREILLITEDGFKQYPANLTFHGVRRARKTTIYFRVRRLKPTNAILPSLVLYNTATYEEVEFHFDHCIPMDDLPPFAIHGKAFLFGHKEPNPPEPNPEKVVRRSIAAVLAKRATVRLSRRRIEEEEGIVASLELGEYLDEAILPLKKAEPFLIFHYQKSKRR